MFDNRVLDYNHTPISAIRKKNTLVMTTFSFIYSTFSYLIEIIY